MIWDSEPWRNHLLGDMRGLAKRATMKVDTERRAVFVERALFFAAYVMRRLDDSKKLSTVWSGTALKCTRFPPTGQTRPSLMDWQHVERHYDLSKPQSDTMSARKFCDLAVHSFIFMTSLNDDDSIAGFFITSDRLRSKGIWLFALETVLALMQQTVDDRPSEGQWLRNPDTGEMEVWTGNSEPPDDWKRKVERIRGTTGASVSAEAAIAGNNICYRRVK